MCCAPRMFVCTASNGLYSHAGTCFMAAAWTTMSAPCIARTRRDRFRTSPTKKRRLPARGKRACISDCFSSSREKTRMTASGHRSVTSVMNALPKEPVPPVRRIVAPERSMWSEIMPDRGCRTVVWRPAPSRSVLDLLRDVEHPLQGDSSPLGHRWFDHDLVDHGAGGEV